MKLRKKPADNKSFYVDFTNELSSTDTILSISSIQGIPSGLTIDNESINGASIDDIEIGKAVQFTCADGTDGYEYIIRINIITTEGEEIESDVVLLVTEATQIPIDYYGNVLRASQYFKNRLNTDAWDDSENPQQRIALFEATQLIDKLNFAGDKTDEDQLLEFPRGTDSEIPRNIEFATYELAYELLDGVEVNQEVNKMTVESQSYASVRTTYNRTNVPEYIIAGIPSPKAWHLLRPYLRDSRHIQLSRIN